MFRIPLGLTAALMIAAMPAAQGAIIIYTATLNGATESPANGSFGLGFASAEYDSVGHTLTINATFQDLQGPTTAAHIHCCTAVPFGTINVGVAVTPSTLPNFPLNVTSGNYGPQVLDLTQAATYTSTFLTGDGGGSTAGAEAALLAGMNDNRAYFNIHTTAFAGGEIRGFLAPVPAPAAAWLFAPALGLLGPWMRRR